MSISKFILLVVLMVLLNACVSGTMSLKGYENISRQDAAILHARGTCTPNWAFSLDLPDKPHVRTSYDICGLEGCKEFIVPPGAYHVFYICKGLFGWGGETSYRFHADLKSGHVYVIKQRGGLIKPRASLIDESTGRIVSESH